MSIQSKAELSAENELKGALSAFETSLATPVISGELADWLDAVKKSWAAASAQVQHQARERHPQQYDEISKADPELFPRVEQLQAEDEAIEADRATLDNLVARMSEHVPKLEPDEEKAQHHTKTVTDDGMAFIARVRKQEVALQTWFVEAFNRDRGSVD
jgi:hypothetical protein